MKGKIFFLVLIMIVNGETEFPVAIGLCPSYTDDKPNPNCPCGYTGFISKSARHCKKEEYCMEASEGFTCKRGEDHPFIYNTCRSIHGCYCKYYIDGLRFRTRLCSFGQVCKPGAVEGHVCFSPVPELKFKCPDRDDLKYDRSEQSYIQKSSLVPTDCSCNNGETQPSSLCKASSLTLSKYNQESMDSVQDKSVIVTFRQRKAGDTNVRKWATSRKGVIHPNRLFIDNNENDFQIKYKDDAAMKVV
jgi:hypothetical protein